MVPQTFPSTLGGNGYRQMVIFKLSSLTGLTRWIDYIPVKTSETQGILNSYDGNMYVNELGSITGRQAWLDYIPAYEDASATDAWQVSANGYIPIYA
jgi:hypothetical protein